MSLLLLFLSCAAAIPTAPICCACHSFLCSSDTSSIHARHAAVRVAFAILHMTFQHSFFWYTSLPTLALHMLRHVKTHFIFIRAPNFCSRLRSLRHCFANSLQLPKQRMKVAILILSTALFSTCERKRRVSEGRAHGRKVGLG
jgi:hypothetical protein